jgi:hypothetical protein
LDEPELLPDAFESTGDVIDELLDGVVMVGGPTYGVAVVEPPTYGVADVVVGVCELGVLSAHAAARATAERPAMANHFE